MRTILTMIERFLERLQTKMSIILMEELGTHGLQGASFLIFYL